MTAADRPVDQPAAPSAGRGVLIIADDPSAAAAAGQRGFGATTRMSVLAPPSVTETIRFVGEVRSARRRGDVIVFFVRGPRAGSARFLWGFALLTAFFPSAASFLGSSGTVFPVWRSIFRHVWPLAPLLSIAQVLRLPFYAVREVVPALLTSDRGEGGPVVGYGSDRGVGGQAYWLIFPPKVRRFGLFGLANDTYMGMPLGLHSWPLSIVALSALGYRLLFLVSTAMIAGGAWWIFAQFGHASWAWLIPVTLLSNYYLFNLTSGTWEVLAWGVAMLMFASLLAVMPVLAGVLAAALLLCHPGVTMLAAVTTLALMLTGVRPVTEYLTMGGVAAVLGAWWLIPYRAASTKLGRKHILGALWQLPMKWSRPSSYQFGAFAIFSLIATMSGRAVDGLVLVVPLAVLYVNTRISWIFSQYTVTNLMLVLGLIVLARSPSLPSAIAFGFVVFTPPTIMWARFGRLLGLDVEPIRVGDTKAKLGELVASVNGRLAHELGRDRNHPGWSSIAALSCFLADSGIDLFTAAYTEIGDYEIYRRTIPWFNVDASRAEFQRACHTAGVSHFMALTPSFRDRLLEWGCEMLGETGPLALSDVPDGERPTLTLFRLPWPASLVEPPVSDFEVEPNRMRFTGRAGASYTLRFSAFHGWRATECGRPLRVSDATPGMRLDVSLDGPVELRYSLANYLRHE